MNRPEKSKGNIRIVRIIKNYHRKREKRDIKLLK
jgi:hypothetical protein